MQSDLGSVMGRKCITQLPVAAMASMLLSISCAISAQAQSQPKIYSFTDENGVVHYTNDPSKDSRYQLVYPRPDSAPKLIAITASKLTFKAPADWVQIGGATKTLMEAWAKETGQSRKFIDGVKDLELIVHAKPPDATRFASIVVSRNLADPFLMPGNLRRLTDNQRIEFGKGVLSGLRGIIEKAGGTIISAETPVIVELNGTPAIKIRYVRSGLSGPVEVEQLQFGNALECYTIVLSWRQSERQAWAATMNSIRASILVDR